MSENTIDASYLTPTIFYKLQGMSDQLDLGLYAVINRYILGCWYRGIPVKKYDQPLQNNESIVLLGGYKFSNLSISCSYDHTVSLLRKAGTWGLHELNVTYTLQVPKKVKVRRKLPCPDFN